MQHPSTKISFIAEDTQTVVQTETWNCSFFSCIADHHSEVLRTAVVTQAKAVSVTHCSRLASISESDAHAIEWLAAALEVLGITLREYQVKTPEGECYTAQAAGIL